jgi:hypothetical protein
MTACGSHKLYEHIWVRPSTLLTVHKSPDSPAGCVTVRGIGGKQLYIEGTPDTLMAAWLAAQIQEARCLGR